MAIIHGPSRLEGNRKTAKVWECILMARRRPGLRRTKPQGAQAQVNASKQMRPRRVLSPTLLLLGIASVFGVVLFLQKTDLRDVATQPGTNGGLGEREALSEPASSEIRALFVPLEDSTLTPEEKDRLLRQEQLDLAQLLADAFPHDGDARFLLAMAHQEQGDSVSAVQHLEACSGSSRGVRTPTTSWDVLPRRQVSMLGQWHTFVGPFNRVLG